MWQILQIQKKIKWMEGFWVDDSIHDGQSTPKIQIADGIISGEVPADEESKKICQNSLFSIRKLLSVFEDYFEA